MGIPRRSLAVVLAGLLAAPAAARPACSYHAWIGPDDLYNSRGMRLEQPWQVLRQDRANFHKGLRQRGDEWEGCFATPEARAELERHLRRIDWYPPEAAAIVGGGVLVEVQFFAAPKLGVPLHAEVMVLP